MCNMDHKLTYLDYERAKENGISEKTLWNRFYNLLWDKERAVTEPVRKGSSLWEKYGAICEKNGIGKRCFLSRINRGWDPKMAAEHECLQAGRYLKSKTKLPKEVIEKARVNGIKENTLKMRVYQYGWDLEKAITTPPARKHTPGKYKQKNDGQKVL